MLVAITASVALLISAGSACGMAVLIHEQHKERPLRLLQPGNGKGRGPSIGAHGPCVEDVCNYLLLGSDSRAGAGSTGFANSERNAQPGAGYNSDVIMLVHTDPNLQKAIILSFPRDLWVNIPGHGYGKINSSFGLGGGITGGGPQLVARTVSAITGLKVNHYLYVNLAGFEGVVNTLGGVQMCIPAENVNTPGYVESTNADGSNTRVYFAEVGHIVDPNTGLDVTPGCQRLNGSQSLAYVRTRHLRCDRGPRLLPDHAAAAVPARGDEPAAPAPEARQGPEADRSVSASMRRDSELTIADLAYLVGQLRGISTGSGVPHRSRHGPSTHDRRPCKLKIEPSRSRSSRPSVPASRWATWVCPRYTPPSPANIKVTVIDHSSSAPGGQLAAGVEQVLSTSGFDVSPGIVAFDASGSGIPGNWIAYAPGNSVEALVVQQYFPNLQVKEVKGLKGGVAIFVSASYEPVQPGAGSGAPPDCVKPAA